MKIATLYAAHGGIEFNDDRGKSEGNTGISARHTSRASTEDGHGGLRVDRLWFHFVTLSRKRG
jgi:hypothetical protein